MRERARDAWLRLQAGDKLPLALATACSFAVNAAFPRLVWKLRWHRRLGLRGHLVFIGIHIALAAALAVAMGRLKAWVERLERLRDEFRRRHGRDPTEDEFIELVRSSDPS